VNSTTLTPQLRGTWLGITADINIPEDQINACNHLENDDICPVVEGIVYDYQFTLAPAMSDPLVTAEQEFKLMGDNNQVVFCYKLRNTVTNP
jgi:ML domain